jgi:hypothetical protein
MDDSEARRVWWEKLHRLAAVVRKDLVGSDVEAAKGTVARHTVRRSDSLEPVIP